MKIKFNKILIFSCVFLLVVCSFTSCFAFSYTSDDKSINIDIDFKSYGYDDSTYPYYYIMKSHYSIGDVYVIRFSSIPLDYTETDMCRTQSDWCYFTIKLDDLSIYDYEFIPSSTYANGSSYPIFRKYDLEYVIYSSHDIKDLDGNVVFQGAPIPERSALAKVVQEAEPAKKFQTTIVGILPYLIAFLVGLVAFWKAWSILSRWLHRA